MNLSTLKQFDLNSLLTLKILLETQHVTRAAEKLHLTQSAVSRTLAKLREQLNDPLLVRSGNTLVSTNTAKELLPKVNAALEQISNILDPQEFDPRNYEGTIRLATTDYGTHNLLPKLVPLLYDVAPKLKLSTIDWRSNLLTDLEDNNVDLIIGGVMDPPNHIHQRIVSNDVFQGVLRKGHPCAGNLSKDKYLSLKHVLISSSGKGKSEVDTYLNEQGMQRDVVVTVPHFFAALEIISATDLMILLPSNFIRRYVDPEKFAVVEPPFPAPTLEIAMFWHARSHHEPLNRWFRQFVYDNLYARHQKKQA